LRGQTKQPKDMNMNGKVLLGVAVLALGVSAQAALFGPWSVNQAVDYVDSINVDTPSALSGSPVSLVSVIVKLTFTDNNVGHIGGSISIPSASASQGFNLSGLSPVTGHEFDLSFSGTSAPLYNQDPNKTWHLSLYDSTALDIGSTLVSWSLDITAVPEPVNVALGIFGGVFVVGGLCRTQQVRSRLQRCWAGFNHWLDAV
jgi:hypothetical protein